LALAWAAVPCLTTTAAGAPTPIAKAADEATARVVMRDRRITHS
jgi:hypothetical protein